MSSSEVMVKTLQTQFLKKKKMEQILSSSKLPQHDPIAGALTTDRAEDKHTFGSFFPPCKKPPNLKQTLTVSSSFAICGPFLAAASITMENCGNHHQG